jgi:hypothetical protein
MIMQPGHAPEQQSTYEYGESIARERPMQLLPPPLGRLLPLDAEFEPVASADVVFDVSADERVVVR